MKYLTSDKSLRPVTYPSKFLLEIPDEVMQHLQLDADSQVEFILLNNGSCVVIKTED